MNRKMKMILAAAMLAAVILVMATGMISKAKGQPIQQPQPLGLPTSQSTALIDRGNDPNLASAIPETDSDRITATVQGFILTYGGQSWDDPSPTYWITRTREFATPEYADKLAQQFGKANARPFWSEFVEEETVRQPVIDELRIVQTQGFSKGLVTVIVDYRITTATKEGTPDAFETFNRMVQVVNVNKEWLVNDFRDVAAGYAPSSGEVPSAPAVAPQVGH